MARAPVEAYKLSSMNRDSVLNLLRAHKAPLTQKFGVSRLALFGSVARDSATAQSDVDVLVSFVGPATWIVTLVFSSTWKTSWAVQWTL